VELVVARCAGLDVAKTRSVSPAAAEVAETRSRPAPVTAASAAGPLPRQPCIRHDHAGQAQLGVAGQHQPSPAVALPGMPRLRRRPTERLLTESNGVLQIEPADVRPPRQVEIQLQVLGSGPPQPQHLRRARAGGDALDLHAQDGAPHDRPRPAGAVAGVALLLGMQPCPGGHGDGAVLVVARDKGGGWVSQRGQVVTSTAKTGGSAGGRWLASRSRSCSTWMRPRAGGSVGAARAAPVDWLQAQVRQRWEAAAAQQRVAQLEQRIGAAGEAGMQLSPEQVEPRKGEAGINMAAQPDRTEHQQAT
jgi:hypothetical protein